MGSNCEGIELILEVVVAVAVVVMSLLQPCTSSTSVFFIILRNNIFLQLWTKMDNNSEKIQKSRS